MDGVEINEWNYIPELLNSRSVVYSFGVGRNIDFDLDMIGKVGCNVYAFDPTPGTKEWLDRQNITDKFIFYPWGIYDKDGIFDFYDNECGNWSLYCEENKKYIKAPFFTFKTIIKSFGKWNYKSQAELFYADDSKLVKVDLMKLDIEGAEHRVIEDIFGDRIFPKQLLVEFHSNYLVSMKMLKGNGYEIFKKYKDHFSFVRAEK